MPTTLLERTSRPWKPWLEKKLFLPRIWSLFFLLTTQSKRFPFLFPLTLRSDVNSYIWSSWTSSRGSLWLRELTIPGISSSHWTWHGHSCESSPVSCFTVYPRKPLISFTAATPPTERHSFYGVGVMICPNASLFLTSAVGSHLCVFHPNKWCLFPIARPFIIVLETEQERMVILFEREIEILV